MYLQPHLPTAVSARQFDRDLLSILRPRPGVLSPHEANGVYLGRHTPGLVVGQAFCWPALASKLLIMSPQHCCVCTMYVLCYVCMWLGLHFPRPLVCTSCPTSTHFTSLHGHPWSDNSQFKLEQSDLISGHAFHCVASSCVFMLVPGPCAPSCPTGAEVHSANNSTIDCVQLSSWLTGHVSNRLQQATHHTAVHAGSCAAFSQECRPEPPSSWPRGPALLCNSALEVPVPTNCVPVAGWHGLCIHAYARSLHAWVCMRGLRCDLNWHHGTRMLLWHMLHIVHCTYEGKTDTVTLTP